MELHDRIQDRFIEATYRFTPADSPVNQAARLPARPAADQPMETLEQVQATELAYLSQNGQKKVSKETKQAIPLQTLPRGNYEATISLNGNIKKFFERDYFRVKDIFVFNSPMNGQKYMDQGKTVQIHSGVTSSFNRFADTVTLLRKIEGEDGESHCYAGRVDQKGPTPTSKAEEMARMIFLGEFDGKGGKGIQQIGANLYTLQFAVQSVMNSSPLPFLSSELKQLTNEIDAYCLLVQQTEEKPLEIIHPKTHEKHYVKVLCPLFSQTQFNWTNQLSALGDSLATGELLAKEISTSGDAFLFEKAEQSADPKIKDTASLLKKGNLKPWEEVLLRAYLCHLLAIPEVIHCKSSVDRTGVAVAIASSLKQWLQSGRAIPLTNGKHNILKIVDQWVVDKDGNVLYPFKELFACNLRKGLIETELSRGERGFKLNRGWCQSLALQDLVPDRYLKPYDAKDLKQRITIRLTALIISVAMIIMTVISALISLLTLGKKRLLPLKRLDVLLSPLKAFRPGVFPTRLIDETSVFGKDLIFKKRKPSA